MPLNKPDSIDLRFAPYELKRDLVISKCTGCGWFVDLSRMISRDEEMFGCMYPNDIAGLNFSLHEPFVTLVEIAHATCLFWSPYHEPEEYERKYEDWTDKAIDPNNYASINT